MTVRQKDTAKTDVMTATKNIVIRGIVDDSQFHKQKNNARL